MTTSSRPARTRLAAAALATLALTAVGGTAHAKGGGSGSTSGLWPVAVAPLPAGVIQTQTSTFAQVLSTTSVATVLTPLDAAYVAAGYTIHPPQVNVPREYDGPHVVQVFIAGHDPSGSYVSLQLVK